MTIRILPRGITSTPHRRPTEIFWTNKRFSSELAMERTYENAMRLLESRQRGERPKEPSFASATLRGVSSLEGMKEWLEILGHSDNDLASLNIIHVAGTKGKGNTCAFVRSFLQAHGQRTGFPSRIGLYTSPDLRHIRERIQLNDSPITEALFTKYFFDVWTLLANKDGGRKPRRLQLLFLLAMHVFRHEGVDVAIVEVHHGGEFCATNAVARPRAVGIASIGFDHVAQLGPTLADIAWHKAGIMKAGTPAFALRQEQDVEEVLVRRARDRNVALEFVEPIGNVDGLMDVQKQNCALALALVQSLVGHPLASDDIGAGIRNFSWPGRFETIRERAGKHVWYLDGAHNEMSVRYAAEWFARSINTIPDGCSIILIFTHISSSRDGVALLGRLIQDLRTCGVVLSHVIFTTFRERLDGTVRIDKASAVDRGHSVPALYAAAWTGFDPTSRTQVITEPTIEGALDAARREAKDGEMRTLVTGSLHLVGGALGFLRPGGE